MPNNGISTSFNSSGKPLRLLCIEDSPRDVKLMAAILEKSGYRLALESVDDPTLFRQRLQQGEHDVIVCDFNLKDWTAIDALEIVKESEKDVPVVVLSGSLGDEAAVECIKHGATDYVLKDRMARLPLAIQRALEARAGREEKRRTESARKQDAEQYRLLFEANPNPMWVFDQETMAILAVNEAAVRHYGYSSEEFLKIAMPDLALPEEVPRLLLRLQTVKDKVSRMGSGGLFIHRRRNGEVMEVEVASSPLIFQGRASRLVLINDVTERNSLQAQFLQAQKMESLGRLAGGMAHDINNLMGVVLGYSELTLECLDHSSPLRKGVEGMQNAATRAVAIVRQLLAFSRKQILQPRILNLNTIVHDMEDLLRQLLGENIQLSITTHSQLGTVKADQGQMEQVIMNLAVNARDAMPHGGQLAIGTSNVEVTEADPQRELDCPFGSHVMLEVADTGCGMDAKTQARIFEPFFTTKDPGKGTGLGLATVYGIVKQSGGNILVHSQPGHGTTFRICLPRAEAPPKPQNEVKLAAGVAKGSETILLVEDAESLREVVRQFLQYGGYKVLVADGGIAALAASEKHIGTIHLLLTDVMMPGLSGPQLMKELHTLRPGLRVLFMSGYADDALGPQGMLKEGTDILEKPFSRTELLRKLREVLDSVKIPA